MTYKLKQQHLDIWQFSLQEEHKSAIHLLSSDETLRAERYHFPRHRRQFVMARAMLRQILGKYLQMNPSEIEFTYNEHGKPEIKQDFGLHFNLTHSHDLALLAVGQDYPLGIDIEFFSPRPYVGIGQHIFSSQENKQLQALSNSLKPLCFFHLWAQKEALIKACGLGLSYPTKSFDLPCLPSPDVTVEDKEFGHTWRVHSFMPTIACSAAVCYHPTVQHLEFRHYQYEAL